MDGYSSPGPPHPQLLQPPQSAQPMSFLVQFTYPHTGSPLWFGPQKSPQSSGFSIGSWTTLLSGDAPLCFAKWRPGKPPLPTRLLGTGSGRHLHRGWMPAQGISLPGLRCGHTANTFPPLSDSKLFPLKFRSRPSRNQTKHCSPHSS